MTTHDDTTGTHFTPHNPYEQEAKERWGHTDAWKQSQERAKKMSKADFERIGKEGDELMKKIAAAAEAGKQPTDAEVQSLIAEHYNSLRHWYEPNLDMYRGLASMYVDDSRFAANIDKYRPGLAVFMRDAMHAYCDAQGSAAL